MIANLESAMFLDKTLVLSKSIISKGSMVIFHYCLLLQGLIFSSPRIIKLLKNLHHKHQHFTRVIYEKKLGKLFPSGRGYK